MYSFLSESEAYARALHFFVEDVSKIFVLASVMIYLISLLRYGFDANKVRMFLSGKKRIVAYFLAALFGAITPFCSCSSIPLFLGFVSAGIPLGITMAFLITSPMINEVAVLLLGSTLGIEFTVVYIGIGFAAGMAGGAFFDFIGADKHLTELGKRAQQASVNMQSQETVYEKGFAPRHAFGIEEVTTILGRIWKWIIVGIGAGAIIHGFVPEEWFYSFVDKSWWTVPVAVVSGIPMYSGATATIPVVQSLIAKGVPMGTAIAFMMSVVAASFPEFVMLHQVMKKRLLLIFFLVLLVFFTISGWILNSIF